MHHEKNGEPVKDIIFSSTKSGHFELTISCNLTIEASNIFLLSSAFCNFSLVMASS